MRGWNLALVLFVLSSSAFADVVSIPGALNPVPIPTITSGTPTTPAPTTPAPTTPSTPSNGVVGGLPIISGPSPVIGNPIIGSPIVSGPLATIDQIVNEGTKVWTLIQQNKATSSFSTSSANAIPAGVTAWDQIGGWRMKGGKNYQLPILADDGTPVFTWDARVSFEYNGNVQGKGQFLRNVTVQASDIQVDWAHNFNAKVTIPDSSISNYGDATNPVAQMEVEIDYSYDTSVFVHRDSSVLLVVRGDGTIEDISSDDDAPTPIYPIGRGK